MSDLRADLFRKDPRVVEAKRLVLEALEEHQAALGGVRDPDPERGSEYAELLRGFGRLRGADLYYPYVGSGFGRGTLVELADGSVKRDLICGIGVHFLGHGHPALVEAALDAALSDLVMQGNLQQNRESERVARRLLALANRNGAGFEHVFLTTSGAMANENGLKMALQKHAPAGRLLAFDDGFAGRTLALSQLTDRAAYREGLPECLAVDYVPFLAPGDLAGSTSRSLLVLGRHLDRYPGQYAAMVFELVQGEGGGYPGDAAFFRPLMELLRSRGVAVLVDEVQTFGRTLQPFAYQQFGLDALVDLVTVGKLSQVCATLFRGDYRPRPGLVSQTFTGSTAAIFAALQVLEVIERGDLFGPEGRNARLHRHFTRRLKRLSAAHPDRVRGPFGSGAMLAFTPLDGSPEAAKQVAQALFRAGLVAFVAGHGPSRVRFLLPTPVLEEVEVDAACDLLEQVLQDLAEGR